MTHCPLPIRKNACLVCSICFTCSKTYGVDCTCDNIQPRRGKNLPGGSLDSRAKKLHAADKEDYDFSIQWLTQNAHAIYKNEHEQVAGLLQIDEVSLCKAHSSTLYRAKKRHLRRLSQQTPPSPTDSPPLRRHSGGGLAAKVKEIQYQYPPPTYEPPDFTLTASTSIKRKRTHHRQQQFHLTEEHPLPLPVPPLSSTSTPLFTSNPIFSYQRDTSPVFNAPLISQQLPPLQRSTPPQQQQQQSRHHHHHHQHHRPSTSSSLFTAFQQQAYISPPSSSSSSSTSSKPYSCDILHHHHHHPHSHPHQQQQQQQRLSRFFVETISLKTDRQQTIRPFMVNYKELEQQHLREDTPMNMSASSSSSSLSSTSSPPTLQNIMSSTSTPSPYYQHQQQFYFIRNLAITDTFTFYQLLEEIEMETPPVGKRIVISNSSNDTFYPLHEPIRSVLSDPPSPHVELCIGLCDKPTIDWSSIGSTRS